MSNLDSITQPVPTEFRLALRRYQRVLLFIYVVGFVVMLVFNLRCYAGTYIGQIGWALIWPFSVFGYIVEFGFQLNNAVVADTCPAFIQEAAKGILPR